MRVGAQPGLVDARLLAVLPTAERKDCFGVANDCFGSSFPGPAPASAR
jgi:hypothetical protein